MPDFGWTSTEPSPNWAVGNSPGWQDILVHGLDDAAASYNSFLRADLANEALAKNSSATFDANGRVRSVGGSGLDLTSILPWLLILLAVGFVWKMFSK